MTAIFCDYFKFTLPGDLSDNEITSITEQYFDIPFSMFDSLYQSRDRYSECYTVNDLVSVYRGGFAYNKGTTCFDISAAGLKNIPQIDIADLCRLIISEYGNLCRFDATADDIRNVLPYDEMVSLCLEDNFKKRVKTKLCRNRTDAETGEGIPTYPEVCIQPRKILFGSPKSKNYLVIYDKEYVSGVSYPYLRVELRLTERKDTAALARVIASGADIPSYLAGIIRGKLDFLQDNAVKKANKKTMPWWNDFLQGASSAKLKRDPPTASKDLTASRDIAIISRALNRLVARKNSAALDQVYDMLRIHRASPEVCDLIGEVITF